MTSTSVFAQDGQSDNAAAAEDDPVIVVTGSQVQGSKINDVLPVTVLDEAAIETTGAGSGEELFQAIPQVGQANFNEQNTTGGVNGARGDIASINLRDLGTGNTLLLINGRRMVLHPGFQTELLVPVVSPDTNEIAPGSVRRLEVLRDGASAVYGADAVAGVINTQLRGKMRGGFVEAEVRASEGTSLYSTEFSAGFGFDFAKGRGNLTLYGGYFYENGAPSTMRDYSSNDNLTPFLVGTPFEGDSQFNNVSTITPFGQFDIQLSNVNNRTRLGDDDFFLTPCALFGPTGQPADGRFLDLGNGLCADNGTSAPVEQRYNTNFGGDLFSEKDRYNFAALFSYELSDSVEFYFEGSFYRTKSQRLNDASANLTAVPFGISKNAYWNPLGATTLLDGSPNPNRIPNLVGSSSSIPASGADLIMERYRYVDVGNRLVTVDKNTYRLVAGFRGNFGDWDFDTGFVYSQANSLDLAKNRVSLTNIQNLINRNTPDAYNPFNGGCLDNVNEGDCTPNPDSVLEEARIDVFRKGETTLALADFKLSRNNLFTLPAGDVGVATGVEFRRETFIDDRDPRLDGTITFTDSITGEFNGSDVLGSSPSPDTSGSRNVYSAYAEFLIPVVSEDMEIPMVNSFNVQLAGRIERIADIKETAAVPRVAAAWSPVRGLLFRGAWSRAFRAPNLVQVNDEGTTRVNTRDDYVRCQAQVEKNQLSDLGACSGVGTVSLRTGTQNLKPEKSESINFGLVLEPDSVPGLTLTVDYWRVRQNGIVGVFGDDNAIALDLLLRQQGSSNPNVIRNAPEADDITLFTGTSLAPAGSIIQVLDPYLNLDSRVSKGWDFGFYYDLPDFGIGDIRLRLNAARLKSFFQTPGPEGQLLLDAIASNVLPTEVAVGGIGELIEIEGRPKWRLSGSVNWSKGPVDISLFGKYIDHVFDTSATNDVTGEFYRVDDMFTLNASISYTFKNKGALDGTRIKFGVNNVFDTDPPLADESRGFFSELHSARGRQFVAEIRKKF
ncbi:MAG: TonB-dependent receptor [Blastomonas sp.]